jgi:RNA polymerase sigma-70 factor (ECF subfamily)
MQDDKEMIEKALQGDRGAFGEMYELYAAHLYRYISFRINHPHDAEDILSSVFLKSFETLAGGKRVTHLRAFLYQTARNAIVDHFRKNARVQEYEMEAEESNGAAVDANSTSSISIDRESDLAQVRQGMRALRREYQEVIQLRYIEELEIEEIAIALEKSQVGVRVLIHRAMRALKRQLGISTHE